MKITVYTVSDCQFSKAEKEYLQSHNLPYEEKNLEQNREWLTEMLAVSNNFAGTPVTKIEKDDGQIVVLKGFTQEEFDQVLGFKKQEGVAQALADATPPPQSTSPQPPTETPSTTQPEASPPPPPSSSYPTQSTAGTSPTQTPPVINEAPTTTPPQPVDPLSSILSDLEQKANPNQQPPPPSSNPPSNIPNIPDFNE